MTWDDVCSLPCSEFIAWMDERHREPVVRGILACRPTLAEVEAYEAWGLNVLYAWKNGRVGRDFNDAEHVRRWCLSRMWSMLGMMWGNESQRRGTRGCRLRATECLISELAMERYDEALKRMSLRSQPPTMSPGGEGWLSSLLDDLTPKQRAAVEMLVLAGMMPAEAAELEPSMTAVQFNGARRQALKRCRCRLKEVA